MRGLAKAAMALWWGGVLGVHALSALGSLAGGWLLGIMGDGWQLLCAFDALCIILWAVLALGLKSVPASPLAGWATRSRKAATALAFAWAGLFLAAPWVSGGFAGEAGGGALSPVTLLQGNAEAKGNPFGWDYDVVAIAEAPGAEFHPPEGMRLAAGLDGSTDTALWTRLPVIASGVVDADSPWRQGVWARVQTPSGPLVVISIHTRSPTSADWNQQRDAFFKTLEAFLATLDPKEPVALAGDFNATQQTRSFRELLKARRFNQEPNPYAPTWHSGLARFGLGFRIDRVLGDNGARVGSWQPMPLGPSDHLFSKATILVPAR